jgi:hypothetical protein
MLIKDNLNIKDVVNELYGRAADYSAWGANYTFRKSDAELMRIAADLINALNREVQKQKSENNK